MAPNPFQQMIDNQRALFAIRNHLSSKHLTRMPRFSTASTQTKIGEPAAMRSSHAAHRLTHLKPRK